jgi:nucleoporin POM152
MHGTRLLDQPTFNSIQPHTRFQLHTSAVGRKYYEVKQIGDASYPLEQHRDVVIPRDDRLLFEQQVLARPSASFVNDKRMFYCLHDSFTPQSGSSSSGEGTIQFEGTAPFEVQLTIKSMGSSETRVETVTVPTKIWQINLPNFRFSSVGPHTVTINDVKDASACEQAPAHLGRRRIWIVVAESAAIVPFDRREHYCVGDVSSFVLEGLAPWTIG